MGGLHSSYEAKPKPHKNAHRQQQAVRHDGNRIDTKPDQLQRMLPLGKGTAPSAVRTLHYVGAAWQNAMRNGS
ncbi:hypothetical protein GQ600_22862 [Phytophthora cactorum]|nr:hypothetical protein GQ600_344 [Phytophthora cactorum]KAF1785828.1 hypothetical protein GQ600_22857 [Phytophthora cactorum]KAF1785833.1 hypothetical protein GQ600_22862 [Phytophthora cactorum]